MPETPDPRAPRAPYMRVRDALLAEIEAGTYGPGDRIPSDAELSAAHGVAPMTARRAVRELREQGVIYTEWGKGSFVTGSAGDDQPGEGGRTTR
ncbi:GntR family transcriptional regulator [Streptomyces sp. JNUCC 64]